MNIEEKIRIIQYLIDHLEDRRIAMIEYIDKINAGMEDPDRDLSGCILALEDMEAQKAALSQNLDLLTKAG